jgi:glutathione S-transferase
MLKLYRIPLSHPAYAAQMMLEHKGLQYTTVEYPAGFHPLLLRAAGFRRGTVPALCIDAQRVQGSLQISQALEAYRPERPLFPADPTARARVQEAERWGESQLQPVPRRLFRWILVRNLALRKELVRINRMPVPGLLARAMQPMAAYFAWDVGAGDQAVQADLSGLPEHLDHVDRLIAAGTIGAPQRNAADYQIGTSMRFLMQFDDLRPAIEGRPAAQMALQLMPDYPIRVPAVFPAAWLTR